MNSYATAALHFYIMWKDNGTDQFRYSANHFRIKYNNAYKEYLLYENGPLSST